MHPSKVVFVCPVRLKLVLAEKRGGIEKKVFSWEVILNSEMHHGIEVDFKVINTFILRILENKNFYGSRPSRFLKPGRSS
jgi:hypothetical protein